MAELPALVIDNGTGFTKLGYAGNYDPSFVIPTIYGEPARSAAAADPLSDLDFLIGHDATAKYQTYTNSYPMKHGLIDNWDRMEQMWQHCIFKYLRAQPEERYVLLTEPPLNPPENREYTAEVMFETFGVKGLYIGVQAVLALFASSVGGQLRHTGCVVDSGDGVTHVIPVSDGYVIPAGIKHIPLAGRDITNFVHKFLIEREGNVIPREDALAVAQRVKESSCYVCPDVAAAFGKMDKNPSLVVQHTETYAKTGKTYTFDVGPERFLGPEVFFNPALFSDQFTTPLAEVVNQCIRNTPMDVQRGLYSNIVLSGGSTMFTGFDKRLTRDVKRIVDDRLRVVKENLKPGVNPPAPIPVDVISHSHQRYAVWFGGSVLADTPGFYGACHTKAQYDEIGPSICRYNQVFTGV